jgi:ABC-type branched-subunit amino acid transport system ATPase component
MTTAIETRDLTKRFGSLTAVDGVRIRLEENGI